MKLLNNTKRFIIFLLAIIAVITTFLCFTHVFANGSINKEVKQYKYENNDIFYSDGYFDHSSTEYDSHLATLSILMAKFSMNPGEPSSLNDTNWYLSQSNRVKGYLELIGFNDFQSNDDYKKRTGFSTIGVACAKKQVGDYTVISIAVRSGGYFLEWANNIWLGDGTKSDYMHEGWYNAAGKLIDFLKSYLEEYQIKGKIKLWMAGYSRGGAVTNLAAGLLDNNMNNINKYLACNNITLSHNDLYAYTFEAPQGANVNSKTVKAPDDAIYNNIWNIVNPNDLVTKVAMTKYGFTRFGKDLFITTKFYDNANFETNRSTFKKIYGMNNNNQDKYKADNFVMKGITGDKIAGILAGAVAGGPIGMALNGFIISKISGLTSDDKTKANYDSNIVSSLILDELCNAIGSRDTYVKLYQDILKDIMLSVMTDEAENKRVRIAALAESMLIQTLFMAIGVKVPTLLKLLLPDYSDENVLLGLSKLTYLLINAYAEKPNEFLSLLLNINEVFDNHDTDISVGHIMTQDSYYIDLYNKNHDDKISIVPLRDNADLIHMSFNGYNDLQVYDEKNNKIVDVSGHVFGKSDVNKCDSSIAVGYYSYISEEKMELYLPINQKFRISFKDYSKKPYHKISYKTSIQYITASTKNPVLPSGSERTWFNSDRKEVVLNAIK